MSENTLQVGDRIKFLENFLTAKKGDIAVLEREVGSTFRTSIPRADSAEGKLWVPDHRNGSLYQILPPLKVGDRLQVVRDAYDVESLGGGYHAAWRDGLHNNVPVGSIITVGCIEPGVRVRSVEKFSRKHYEPGEYWIPIEMLGDVLPEAPAAEPLVEVGTKLRCTGDVDGYEVGEVVTLVKKHPRVSRCWGTDKRCPGNEGGRWWFFEDYISTGRFEIVAEVVLKVGGRYKVVRPLINFNVGDVFTILKQHSLNPKAWGTDRSCGYGEEGRTWVWVDQTYALESLPQEEPQEAVVPAEEAVVANAEFIPPAPTLVLEVGEVYDTRGGGTARVIAIDCKNETYPVVALVQDPDDPDVEGVESLTAEGRFYSSDDDNPFDLIQEHVPPREPAVVYVRHNSEWSDPWGGAYAVEEEAVFGTDGTTVRRFIEDLSYNPEP